MSEANMRSTTLTWLSGLTFDAQVRSHHLMIDAAGGHGDDRGPTPTELLLVSLAGCTGMDVMSILRKSRQPVTRFVVRCEGRRVADHPKRYTALRLIFEVHGDGVDRAAVERAVSLSAERYCSVQATLQNAPEIEREIVLIGSEGDGEPPARS